ncbi:MAG: nuclear transport factor 2 family protein [Actinomycetota bacterium]|nr:nuclear transport factor 2 family protein [Actinomycetota bacterium]
MSEQSNTSDEVTLQALKAYFAGLSALDAEMIAAVFTEDGELEDPVGSTVRKGRAEIAKYFSKGLCSVSRHLDITPLAIHPTGGSIAVQWHMTVESLSGAHAAADGIDILTVTGDGLISRVEGYWNQRAFLRAFAG